MISHATHISRWLAACSMLLLGLAGCGAPAAHSATAVSPAAAPATAVPPTLVVGAPTAAPQAAAAAAPNEQRIDVGGHALALYCTGSGSPTVILESGLDGDHTSWDQVQPAVAQETRVCSYDRAGLGQSDPGPLPRTSQQIATELHTLLVNAGIAPPYLLVGHSFGGLHIREFAQQHPDEVRGMVFVDAVHEDWWTRAAALVPPPGDNDSERLQSFRAYINEGYRDPASNREGVDIPASVAQVKQSGTFGATPIIVLTAQQFTVLNPGLPPDLEAQLKKLFQEDLQGQLTKLSTNSTQIVVSNSSHAMPHDNPQAIVTAVRALLAATR